MKTKKFLALMLTMVLIIGCFAGCNNETTATQLPYAINEIDVEVIDDLPDWTGDKLDLTAWYAFGTNNMAVGKTKRDDKFQVEIERVSGITLNEKDSFDNGGFSADSKISRIVASNTWPDIGVGLESSVYVPLIEQGMLYDLTEYIPKYMPNFMSYINSSDVLRKEYENNAYSDGNRYFFSHLTNAAFRYIDPEFSEEKYAAIITRKEDRRSFWIRDDILKAIHPEAHTVKELQDIYMERGEFTPEEIKDFTIGSREEFRQLLEDINALDIKENGRKVWPIYTYDGMDNYSLLGNFIAPSGFGKETENTYYCYYDAKDDKIKNSVKADWFKDLLKFYNMLFRDELASKEAFIDNQAMFNQKISNGEYAVIYGHNVPPTQDALKAAGKDFAYRPVFIDTPRDTENFVGATTENLWHSYPICFFKEKLTETQLEQILRLIDFCYTDAGMKFVIWGSEKAGLYEVREDGSFIYTDKEFENAVCYNGDQQVLYDYGYSSFPTIT